MLRKLLLAGAMVFVAAGSAAGQAATWTPSPFGMYALTPRHIDLPAEAKDKPDFQHYYGYVRLSFSPNSGITGEQTRNAFVRALQTLFAPRQASASLILDIALNRNGTRIPLNVIPVLAFTRDDSGRNGNANLVLKAKFFDDDQATPYFAIQQGDVIEVTPKLVFSDKIDPNFINVIASAAKASAALGGHGWLLALSNDSARLAKLEDVQSTLAGLFSTSTQTEPTWSIPVAQNTHDLQYRIVEPDKKVEWGTLTVQLDFSCSQFKTDCGPSYAYQRMDPVLVTKHADGKTLRDILGSDLPRQLTSDLSATPSADRSVQVSCQSMHDALAGAYLGYVKEDADFLMWKELSDLGAFDSQPLVQSACYSALRTAWNTMDLSSPDPLGLPPPRSVSFSEMTTRLRQLSFDVGDTSPEYLPQDFSKLGLLTLTVDDDALYQGPWLTPTIPASATPVAFSKVKVERLVCPVDMSNYQAGPGKFSYKSKALLVTAGDPRIRYVEVVFDNHVAAGVNPTIQQLTVRVASKADYDGFGACTDKKKPVFDPAAQSHTPWSTPAQVATQ